MEREHTLRLVGKNSSEIFLLRYPSTLTDFSEFDFSFFAQGAIDVCNEALKTGNPDFDRIAELRKDFQVAHVYIEHNIRTVYEKIVYDCWIDYVCRRDNIGTSGLWNRFIRCKTPFEKAIFARLCEFRYNRAVNEWLNVIRLQDYANAKMDFIFIDGLSSKDEAAARRNYFDLMFSVTAREMGCRIEDLGVTKVFAVGRVPTAPFMFPNISKEIVRDVLDGFDYSDDYSDIGDYNEVSDQIAMDAFSRMKNGLPQELSSYNIVRGKMEKYSDKIYMPCTLKAAIDLEIDSIIEEGSWLSRCKKCKRYFLRSEKHPEEYCSRFIPGGKTCLELYEEENPRPKMTPELEERCSAVTDEMYSRVDKTMSTKEYEYWHNYLEAMKQKVDNGEITPTELENFLNYSLEVDITKSHPILEVEKKEPEEPPAPKERVVKPFMPERISRSSLADSQKQTPEQSEEPPEQEEQPRERPPKDGFFTSPTVSRKKSERTQVSHIIRNGESRGESREIQKPDPAGFLPFGANFRNLSAPAEEARPRNPLEDLKRLEEQIEEGNRLRNEREEARYASGVSSVPGFGREPSREQRYPDRAEQRYSDRTEQQYSDRAEQRYPEPSREQRYYEPESADPGTGSVPRYPDRANMSRSERGDHGYNERQSADQNIGNQGYKPFEQPDFAAFGAPQEPTFGEPSASEHPVPGQAVGEQPVSGQAIGSPTSDEPAANEPPRPRVIRKNAAAISAYGKAAGTSFAPPEAPVRGFSHKSDESGAATHIGSEPSAASEPGVGSEQSPNAFTPESFAPAPSVSFEAGAAPMPDPEPFKDIGSIFDVLASSEAEAAPRAEATHRAKYAPGNTDSMNSEHTSDYIGSPNRTDTRFEPTFGTEQTSVETSKRTPPRGFWTEDRGLFDYPDDSDDSSDEQAAPESSELEVLKEKKHGKSSKTQRLFDAIMREPDNNPNFRRK